MIGTLLSALGLCDRLGNRRSSQWRGVERAFVAAHPECEVCGTRKHLEVHHLLPFHLRPDLELVPANLYSLCRPHHLLVGHLMSWKSYNPNAVRDAANWRDKIGGRP